jgi:3-phosphoshikimate 1-carboxyvinyltransferase
LERLEIRPLNGPATADGLRVPGSKSITNRALLLAALADGESELHHALFSDDTVYMARALRRLGVAVEEDQKAERFRVAGTGGRLRTSSATLYGGNAGTAVRFLVALACLGEGRIVIDGSERMRQRPITDLVDALRQLGAQIDCPSGCPPVTVEAHGLDGGAASVSGSRSSQYLSALLMVAPYAREDIEVRLSDDLVAKPYVDMTLTLMKQFGVDVAREGYTRFRIAHGQRYRAQSSYDVEADASSAHYFLAAAALTRGRVRVEGVGTDSLQGDARFARILERMGARVTWTAKDVTVEGTSGLAGIDADMGDLSDTALTVAAIAPFAGSAVRVRNVAHLRLQESDRIAAVACELRKLGATVREHDDGWEIEPSLLHGGEVETYDDHRIAMAFSLIGLRVPGIVILDPGCVGKTFPRFFETLERLRGS